MKQIFRPLCSSIQPFSRTISKYIFCGKKQLPVISGLLAGVLLATLFFLVPGPSLLQADPPPVADDAVDMFDIEQAWVSLTNSKKSSSTITGPGILGGERDLQVERTGDSGPTLEAGVGGGAFYYGLGPNLLGSARIEWDGPDGNPDSLAPTGLGGIDLTAGGTKDAFLLRVSIDDLPAEPEIEIFTDEAQSSHFVLSLPGSIYSPVDYMIPFSSFTPHLGEGATFTEAGAITLVIPGTAGLDMAIDSYELTSLLTATSTDLLVDKDEDGEASPGDILQYTVLIENVDDAFDAVATGVAFRGALDLNTTLVVSSVTTTKGSVSSDQGEGDSNLWVDIGTLADGENVTITFEATINEPLPAGVTEVAHQGFISTDTLTNLPTDDPDTDAKNDSTVTPVFSSPTVRASKIDSWFDQDGDNQVSSGDILTYTVTISNEGNETAADVLFSDTPDSNTLLIENSITTTQGTVISGNSRDDVTVEVEIGTIVGSGGRATITFATTITDSLPVSITEISNQGKVVGSNFAEVPTDDPETDPSGDPTVTQVITSP